MNEITYRPDIGIDPRFIRSDYAADSGTRITDTGEVSDTETESTVEVIVTSRQIDLQIADIRERISDLTSGMNVPVDSQDLAASVAHMSDGARSAAITSNDWSRAVAITSDPSTVLSSIAEYDLMEMLWMQIKAKICDWLAGMVEKLPVIGDDLAKKLTDHAEEVREGADFGKMIEKENSRRPSSVSDLIGSLTTGKTHSVTDLIHASRIVNAVNAYISEPRSLEFSAEAVGMAPILERYSTTWNITKRSLSIPIAGRPEFLDLYKGEPEEGQARKWFTEEGKDFVRPLVTGYRIVKDSYAQGRMMELAVYGVRDALGNISHALDSYVHGKDLACCLLDNLLRVSDVVSGKTLRFLKVLRMALMFSFNGLNLSIESPLNLIIDILNQVINAAIGSIVEKLTEALDDWVINLIHKLDEYRQNMGEGMRRCSPFDELIVAAEQSLEGMKDSLMAYIQDYTNSLGLAHMTLTRYSIQLHQKEYARRMIGLLDALIKGIETGIMCKEQGEIEPVYKQPTVEDVDKFIANSSFRLTVSPSESVTAYSAAPSSGEPTPASVAAGADISEEDLRWLQECRDTITDTELEGLRHFLQVGGLL